jgi:flagellar assembly factor FliW
VEDDRILEVRGGILGFSDCRYVLLSPAKGPFCWLQSVDDPALAFVVVDPRTSLPDYEVKLNGEEYSRLGLNESSEVVVLALVTMHLNPLDITMNLLGPLVVNPGNMTALQIVMEGCGYTTRFPYFHNMASDGGKPGPRKEGDSSGFLEKLRAI